MAKNEQRLFTDPFIRALKPKATPYKLSEIAPKGEGRLILRVLPNGTKEFFYRYRPNGRDTTIALGRYDPAGKNGKTLSQIRNDPKTGLVALKGKQRETGDVKEARRAEALQEALKRRKGTFQQLMDSYVEHLRGSGKQSAEEVKRLFRRYVTKPFPTLALTKANEIEPGDIQRILARLVRAGIKRQVNACRAYLSAAFAYGGKADHDPRTAAKEGVLFGLKSNPVALVPVIREYERTGERILSADELREYWLALDKLPVVQAATLRLNLALACQRPSQLLRAGWPELDFAENTLLLRDSKGRGGSRDHLLPLTDFALEQLKPLRERNGTADDEGKMPPPFASDGKRGMVLTTLSVAVGEVSAALKNSKNIPAFQLRDLRRTAETMLQKLGVDKEVRAHLLSHGRSKGVQGKHYERYDFLREKHAALEKWAGHLQWIFEGKSATVVQLPARTGQVEVA